MYMRAFRDLDGHQWSFIHMDLAAIPAQQRPAAVGRTARLR
jgi:hypothetical protein